MRWNVTHIHSSLSVLRYYKYLNSYTSYKVMGKVLVHTALFSNDAAT